MDKDTALKNLIEHLKYTGHIKYVAGLLDWDTQVNLPENSDKQRATQCGIINELAHREYLKPELKTWLETLDSNKDTLSPDEETIRREARRDYERTVNLPSEFVARRAKARSEAYVAWTKAREKSNYKEYQPYLQTQLDLAKEEASLQGFNDNAYEYCIDIFNQDMSVKTIKSLFIDLKSKLVPIVDAITNSPVKPDVSILKNFPNDKQEQFVKEVSAKIGFDYNHGRLDTAVHPFCGGNGVDTRMTTRFHEDVPLDSLFSTIHETGHALYEQGFDKDWISTPLGQYISLGVHESQSRLWENQLGRSKPFWQFWEPRYRELFGEQLASIDSDTLYTVINAVTRCPIRVDSDEVMYNLHIILRFELEQQLFSGQLSLDDLPEAWNTLSQEILGLTPRNHKEGVLQDVHWSVGAFGYFPSYTIGNLMAAQLWYKLRDELPTLDDDVAQGNFTPLLSWLREKIHTQGKRYNTEQIVKAVTGDELSPDALIRYLSERYLPLYDCATV